LNGGLRGCLDGGIRVSAEHGSIEFQEDIGQDAQAKVSIQQQEPLRQKLFFREVEEWFVFAIAFVEERFVFAIAFGLPQPVIRIAPLAVHAQQVRGANGVEARRERLLHQGAEG
jgi:hypothetical protein